MVEEYPLGLIPTPVYRAARPRPELAYSAKRMVDESGFSIAKMMPDECMLVPVPPTAMSQRYNDCTTCASALAFELSRRVKRPYEKPMEYATLPLYWDATHGMNKGAYVDQVLDILIESGTCLATDMPYGDYGIKSPVPESAKRFYRIRGYYNVFAKWDIGKTSRADLFWVKAELALGRPVIVGWWVGKDWFAHRRGVLGVETRRIGAHAMCAVGYGNQDGVTGLYLRNSWSPGWGEDGGAFVCDEAFNADAIEGWVPLAGRSVTSLSDVIEVYVQAQMDEHRSRE